MNSTPPLSQPSQNRAADRVIYMSRLYLKDFSIQLQKVGPMVSVMKVDMAPLEADGFYCKLYENDGTHFTGS
ncbi:hypothetical protein P8452_18722 [Trifolium repens]|nr:hypothetical protein P8452_18722 [Trifolium repens]